MKRRDLLKGLAILPLAGVKLALPEVGSVTHKELLSIDLTATSEMSPEEIMKHYKQTGVLYYNTNSDITK